MKTKYLIGILIVGMVLISGCIRDSDKKPELLKIEVSNIKTAASSPTELTERCSECQKSKIGESDYPTENACSGFWYLADITVYLKNYVDIGETPIVCKVKIDDQKTHSFGIYNGLNRDVSLIGINDFYPRLDERHILEICCTPSWNQDYTKGPLSPERIVDKSKMECITKHIEKFCE